MKMTPRILAVWLAIGVSAAGCKALFHQIVAYRDAWASGIAKREGALENGIQTGDWTFNYESGKRRAMGRYENDHQVGPWTYYYETGVVEWSGAFNSKGKRIGEWNFNHPDETLRARGTYLDDFEDGEWEFFYPDGTLERTGQFDDGKLSGPWTYFHPGGKVKAAGICYRGQRVGAWRVADASGQERIQDVGTKPDIEIVQEKHPNGTVRCTGVTKSGVRVGRWTSWHENGKPRFCCSFKDGRATGVFEARNASGGIIAQGVLVGGAFAEGTIAVQNGQNRAIAPGQVPPAAATSLWAMAEALAAMQPEAVVGVLIAEANAKIEAANVLARREAATPTPTPASATVLAQIEQQPERVPAAPQPDLTFTQREEMKDYVKNYLEGTSKSRPSRKKYGPSAPDTRSKGPGERAELKGKPLPFQSLRCVDGTIVDLAQFRGKQDLLVVVLRGFSGEVCPYCIAQTKALAQSKVRLDELKVEVLVIYPGPKENEGAFTKAYAATFEGEVPPYRIFYDPDLEIVEKLGISGELAFPTTLIVGKDGLVTYAYVGEHVADRPAAIDLLKKIEGMKK